MTILDQLTALFRKRKKVGLTLSGGVARGIVHIGILKVLTEHKIPIDFLSAASSGALVGVFYAAGMDPHTMEKAARRLGWLRFVKVVMARHGPVSTEEIKKFVIKNIGDIEFSDLEIPFAVVAADLKTGKNVVLREGKVADAVAASCAFPGVFVPIRRGPYFLVDGGLTDNVPTDVVKLMGADFIIAADVVPGGNLEREPDNALQIFGRTIDLVMKRLSEDGRKLADILIEPEIPQDIWHLDVDKAARLIKIGEEATAGRILEIKTRLFL